MSGVGGPGTARLLLADGTVVDCLVVEDPERTVDGTRRFAVQPIRKLERWEHPVECDVMGPPGSVATVFVTYHA